MMKTATVRDLRNSFPVVAKWIQGGECVEITRSGKPFARLAPISQENGAPITMPDFITRTKEQFPNEAIGSGRSVVDYDSGDR
jgi:antitoxin (DNA-binding transcriptional repressor) of toxin-antitoxin stability system